MPSSVGRVARTTITCGLVGSGLFSAANAILGVSLIISLGVFEDESIQCMTQAALMYAAWGAPVGLQYGAALGLFVGVAREMYHNEPTPVRQALHA